MMIGANSKMNDKTNKISSFLYQIARRVYRFLQEYNLRICSVYKNDSEENPSDLKNFRNFKNI